MYIRSSSEPPDQSDDQLKSGLRGGFPIKINGYALGSQDNLHEVGRESSTERSCIFGPRVRSRQGSVSRQSSVSRHLDCDQERGGEGALYSFTPFGPLQGKVSGSKLCHKSSGSTNNGHAVSRASSGLSQQRSHSRTEQSSSLLNLSLIGTQDQTDTQDYTAQTDTQNYSAKIDTIHYTAQTDTQQYTAQTDTQHFTAQIDTQQYKAQTDTQKYKAQTDTQHYSAQTETQHYSAQTDTQHYSAQTDTQHYSAQTDTQHYSAQTDTQHYSAQTDTQHFSAQTDTQHYLAQTDAQHYLAQTDTQQSSSLIGSLCETNTQNFIDQSVEKLDNEIVTREDKHQIHEPASVSQPSPAPFMFQRPKEFHKKSGSFGSFGSQVNLCSRNASCERSQRDISDYQDVSSYEKSSEISSHLYNQLMISSKESQSENFRGEIYSERASHLNNHGYNNALSGQKSHTILQECSETNKLSNETLQIASELSEERNFECETTEGEQETRERWEQDRAQAGYETSERGDRETRSQEITEFNIEANIVIRPANTLDCGALDQTSHEGQFGNETINISDGQQNEEQEDWSEVEDISEQEETLEMREEFTRESEQFCVSQDTEIIKHQHVDEKTFHSHKKEDMEQDCMTEELTNISETRETVKNSDLYINPQQKDIIKSCIEELEKLAEFDNEFLPTEIDKYISGQTQRQENGEYEEVEISTEEVIDSDDLEHFHVLNVKSERKRSSSQVDIIPVKEVEVVVEHSDHTKRNSSEYQEIEDTGTKMDTKNQTLESHEIFVNPESYETLESFKSLERNKNDESNVSHESHERDESHENTDCHERHESFFLTETEEDSRSQWKVQNKRERNRTIDYHNLPSLYWAASVQNYHEKQYVETGEKTDSPPQDDKGGLDLAKDGLSLILQKLQEIESKLDNLPKQKETKPTAESRCVPVTPTPEPRRLSLPGRFTSLSDLTGGAPSFLDTLNCSKTDGAQARLEIESLGPQSGLSSTCSTPTLMEMKNIRKEAGYESDSTVMQDSDCEGIIDDKSENEDRDSYKAFNMNIMEISDLESSDEEDLEERSRRIEQMAAAMSLMNTESSSRRAELNMDIDTLSERSEDETEKVERQPVQRSRRTSGRKRSMSRERSVAKIRYCWRCHKAGHENWQCREEVQPGGWCPRCLETSHWEDECWVEASAVTCPICNLPGHLPCIHQATDFRQRKLVIDTFGWLPFKEWFQDLTFRSWWNCSGYTGVPLYKILQRNPEQDLDLGFEYEETGEK